MWEYFEAQWPKSTTPKRAISDYLESSDSTNYNLKDQIRLAEFIVEKEPNDYKKSILLARLYVDSGQDTNAIKQYKKVVSKVGESMPIILDEAADYFEAKGMYWDARKTRALLDKVE
jgi:lipopolysaccharide biosynthesis regulator YciM